MLYITTNHKMKTFELDDTTTCVLGETAKENWSIIDDSKGDFIWMHLNSFPSGHIIIQSDEINNDILFKAGNLCRQNTKYRDVPNLKVCYTKVSNLIKGEKPGSVHYKSNRQVKTLKL